MKTMRWMWLLWASTLGTTQLYAASPSIPSVDPTMTVIEAGSTPADVINLIALPPRGDSTNDRTMPADAAPESDASGAETGTAPHTQGTTFGQAVAGEARQDGQQTAADARAVAQDLAEEARALGRQMADEAARNELGEQVREERERDEERGPPPGVGPPGRRPGDGS